MMNKTKHYKNLRITISFFALFMPTLVSSQNLHSTFDYEIDNMQNEGTIQQRADIPSVDRSINPGVPPLESLPNEVIFRFNFGKQETVQRFDQTHPNYYSTYLAASVHSYKNAKTIKDSTLSDYIGLSIKGKVYQFGFTNDSVELTRRSIVYTCFGNYWFNDNNNRVGFSLGLGDIENDYKNSDNADVETKHTALTCTLGHRITKKLFVDSTFASHGYKRYWADSFSVDLTAEYDLKQEPFIFRLGISPFYQKNEKLDSYTELNMWTCFDNDIVRIKLGGVKTLSGSFSSFPPQFYISFTHVICPGWSYSLKWQPSDYIVNSEHYRTDLLYANLKMSW